jgi:alkanesulfonate monooxygenase
MRHSNRAGREVVRVSSGAPGLPARIKIFTTCPHSHGIEPRAYREQVVDVARWSEAAGGEGILVFTDNGMADPWLVSQVIVAATERLAPLVAVQPAYMHPFSAATMIASIAYLHGRRVYVNMVAGGFRKDLIALGDETPHDERYDRAAEYAQIVKLLIAGETVSSSGRYYDVSNLRLRPPVPPELAPGFMISGSSAAGLEAARSIGAVAVKYPQTADDEVAQPRHDESGMRVGIVTRPDDEDAWLAAFERFPENRKGQIAHRYAMEVSDSEWHRQLSKLALDAAAAGKPYWLGPFENYRTFCPYLVGSYATVAAELARYIRLGFETFILDVPASEEELHHIGIAFEHALGVMTP